PAGGCRRSRTGWSGRGRRRRGVGEASPGAARARPVGGAVRGDERCQPALHASRGCQRRLFRRPCLRRLGVAHRLTYQSPKDKLPPGATRAPYPLRLPPVPHVHGGGMSARVPLILRVPRRLYHHVSRPSTVASSIFRIPYRQQLRESGLLYASLPRQVAVAHDEQIDRLCLLFDLAAQAPLPVFVLGPSEKLWLPTMLHNFGMLNVSKPNLDRLLSNPKWV